MFDFVEFTHRKKSGCYVIPVIVEKIGQARSSNVKQIHVLLIDLDNGDIENKLALLENALGEATLIVESGKGYCHFPAKLDVEYFKQLTAEKCVTRYNKGFPVGI